MLDIGNNMIEKIENIAHLTNLEEFWVGAPGVSRSSNDPFADGSSGLDVTDHRQATTRSRTFTIWIASWLYYPT